MVPHRQTKRARNVEEVPQPDIPESSDGAVGDVANMTVLSTLEALVNSKSFQDLQQTSGAVQYLKRFVTSMSPAERTSFVQEAVELQGVSILLFSLKQYHIQEGCDISWIEAMIEVFVEITCQVPEGAVCLVK